MKLRQWERKCWPPLPPMDFPTVTDRTYWLWSDLYMRVRLEQSRIIGLWSI